MANWKNYPDNLSDLKQLKRLNISSNKFTEFPREILDMQNLEYLCINFNENIPEIPSDINHMEQLKHLDICTTNIKSLPESMLQMKQLYIWTCDDLATTLPERFKYLFEYSRTE